MLLRRGCRPSRERRDPGTIFTDQCIRGIFHTLIILFVRDIGIKHRRTLVHLVFQEEVQGRARLNQGSWAALFVCKGLGGLGMQIGGVLGMIGTLHFGQLCKKRRGLPGLALGRQLAGLTQHLSLVGAERIGLFSRILFGLEHSLLRHDKMIFSRLPLNILQLSFVTRTFLPGHPILWNGTRKNAELGGFFYRKTAQKHFSAFFRARPRPIF
jgi:hypothetical protein